MIAVLLVLGPLAGFVAGVLVMARAPWVEQTPTRIVPHSRDGAR